MPLPTDNIEQREHFFLDRPIRRGSPPWSGVPPSSGAPPWRSEALADAKVWRAARPGEHASADHDHVGHRRLRRRLRALPPLPARQDWPEAGRISAEAAPERPAASTEPRPGGGLVVDLNGAEEVEEAGDAV